MARRRVIKNKRKAVLHIAALFGVLLLIVAGIIAAVLLIGRAPKTPAAQFNDVGFTPADSYVFTGSGFLYTKDGTLRYDDISNEKNSYSLQAGEGTFSLAGSSRIHLIYNNKEFQIIGESYPKETAGSLTSLKCGASFVAALRNDGEYQNNERIQLYDGKGATLFDQLGSDQFIIDYGFYEADGEYLYIISMSLVGNTPITTITLYNATRISTSGVISVQSQLIEQLRFTKSSLFAIGTNQIIRYSISDNRESYRSTVFGWKLMDYDSSGSSPMFLLRPRTGDTLGTVKLLSLSDTSAPAESHRMLQLPLGTINAFLMGGKLIAVTTSGYIQYDLTGKQTGAYEFPAGIDDVVKLDGGLLLLKSSGAYYTLRIV